jgi:phosphoglycolate phosphatase-like HAD superfamily hydrolase
VAIARSRAAAKYGAEPEEVVLIGDTPLDVRAAREAGARCVAVASGPHATSELRAAGADSVLADLTDTETVLRAVEPVG